MVGSAQGELIAQQLRQLGGIHRNPPRFVLCQPLSNGVSREHVRALSPKALIFHPISKPLVNDWPFVANRTEIEKPICSSFFMLAFQQSSTPDLLHGQNFIGLGQEFTRLSHGLFSARDKFGDLALRRRYHANWRVFKRKTLVVRNRYE
jgi:hypothetical protein